MCIGRRYWENVEYMVFGMAHIVGPDKILKNESMVKLWKNGGLKQKLHYTLIDKKEYLNGSQYLWYFPVQTDKRMEYNKPDTTVIDKENRICILIDPSCLFDTKIEMKADEMLKKSTIP